MGIRFPFKKTKNPLSDDVANTKYEKRYIKCLKCLPDIILEVKSLNIVNFLHSGNCGDIIYSLPALIAIIKERLSNLYLNVGVVGQYGKGVNHPLGSLMLNEDIAGRIIPLLSYQSYISECNIYSNQKINVDLDLIRRFPLLLDRGNIARWYFQVFGVNYDLNNKWLDVPKDNSSKGAIVIARSNRYNSPLVDYSFLKEYPNLQFVGLPDEFQRMRKMLPSIQYREVNDFLEMASIISSSQLFIGNQSFPFAIAEGLKINRILEVYFKCPNVTVYGENGYDFCFQPQFEKIVKERYELLS